MSRWMQKLLIFSIFCLCLAGCVQSPEPAGPVVNVDESMEFLEPGLRPEVLLFPDYLLMDGYELSRHGRIPESGLVGAGLRTGFSLSVVRKQFSDMLASRDWKTRKMEMERQAFRLIAALGEEEIEIRAVQGSGPTEIFILYLPEPEEPEVLKR